MIAYYLIRAGSAVSRVAPLALLYAIAGAAARLGYLVPSRARMAARDNIAHAIGQPATSQAVRRAAAVAFRCQALNYVDLMRMDRINAEELEASVVHGDLTPFYEVVAEGRGAIILAAHLGNMDYVGHWLALHGFPVHTVVERLEPQRLFELVVRQRAVTGITVYPAAPETIGALTEALRRGSVVALVADRDITRGGEPVEFFGAPAHLPVGPALLSLRTGAPIVPAYGYRLRDNRMYVTVRPALRLQRSRSLRDDLRQGVAAVARALEEMIARAPEQWIVFEPLWKDGAA